MDQPVSVPPQRTSSRAVPLFIIIVLVLVVLGLGWYLYQYMGLGGSYTLQNSWNATHTAVLVIEEEGGSAWYRGDAEGNFIKQPALTGERIILDASAAGFHANVLVREGEERYIYDLGEYEYTRRGVVDASALGLTSSADGRFVGYVEGDGTSRVRVMDDAGVSVTLGEGQAIRFVNDGGAPSAVVVSGSALLKFVFNGESWGDAVTLAEAPEPLKRDLVLDATLLAVSGESGTIYTLSTAPLVEGSFKSQKAAAHEGLAFTDGVLYTYSLRPTDATLPAIETKRADGRGAVMSIRIPEYVTRAYTLDQLD